MPQQFLFALAQKRMPLFVVEQGELRLLRRLERAGYLDVSFYPAESTADQFAELRGMTPLGRRVLDIVSRTDSPCD